MQFVRTSSGAGHFPVHAQCLQRRAPGEEMLGCDSTRKGGFSAEVCIVVVEKERGNQGVLSGCRMGELEPLEDSKARRSWEGT